MSIKIPVAKAKYFFMMMFLYRKTNREEGFGGCFFW